MNGELMIALVLVAMVLGACAWIVYKTVKGHVPRPGSPYAGFSNVAAYEARKPKAKKRRRTKPWARSKKKKRGRRG